MTEKVEHSVDKSTVTKRKRILLVEDDSTSRLFLLNQLKKRGLEVDTAPNGGIALKKLKSGSFDGVVLDLMLSGVKGRDLIKEIRKKDADLPVFVVTSAQRMEPWRKRGSKAGATKVLDKAAPIESIVAEIFRYLNPKAKGAEKAAEQKSEPDSSNASLANSPPPPVVDTTSQVVPAAEPTPEDSGTAFSRKSGTVSSGTPNTALLRKVADAGRAARGTPPPSVSPSVLTADTPLHIPELADPFPSPTPAAEAPLSAQVEAGGNPALEPTKQPVITPSKTVSSRHEVRELEEQLAELKHNRDELAQLLRDQPVFSSGGSEPSAAIQETLDEAKAATMRAEAAYQAELARSRQFEEELKRIRETRDELNRKLAEDEKAAAEARKRSKELEERLEQSAAELEQAKAQLQKNVAEHSALETDFRAQIISARESADVAKVAYQEQAARAQRLTEELEALRKAREDLNARLTAEMQAAAESKRRTEEREQQLREREAEAERLKAELNRRAQDNELSRKLSAAQVAAQNAQAVYKEEAARGAHFDKQLARLNQAREELNTRLAREEQVAAEARRRSDEMEQQLAARNAELERLKSDLHRHAEERKVLEQQLQQQVAKASDAAERVRRELQEGTRTFHRSSEDVAALRQARDQLNATLEREQQAATQPRRHNEGAEGKLQAAAQELAHLRTELEKHVHQPSTGKLDSKNSPAPETAKQRPGLAARIIAPFKIFSSRSEGSAIQELEAQLAEVTRNRDELLLLLRDRPIFGLDSQPSGKPDTLQEAKAAASRAEAAHQAELARSRQFEEELKRIREARNELDRKLAKEEKATEESRRRSKELEERLTQSAAELEQAKAELQNNIAEHSALERNLRQQLDSTRQFAEHAQLAFQKQAALVQQSTEELGALRNAREDLNARLAAETEAAAESRLRSEEREQQLRTWEGKVNHLKTELGGHAADKELSAKLCVAQSAAEKAQAAYQEETGRSAQFEQELGRLHQAREELNTKLGREEQARAEARQRSEETQRQLTARAAELQRLKSELHRHTEERRSLEQQLQQQVAAAADATKRVRREFQEETSFFHRSTDEVDALRRARDELNARLEREHQVAVESRRQGEALDGKLQAAARELAHLRAELEKHANERASIVTASSRQLNAAKLAAEKAEKAYKEQLKRSAHFEKELTALRDNGKISGGKLKAGQKSAARSRSRIEELEKQAAAHSAELEKTRARFEKLLSERERLECERPGDQREPAPAEARFRESIAALARVTAQIEAERSARRRVDERAAFLSGQLQYLQEESRKHVEIDKETQQRISDFEQQVRERETELAKTLGDFQKEAAARQLVQAQLKATGNMGNQFQEQFNLLDEAKRVFNAAQEKLQARLETTLAAHKQAEIELQRQVSGRKRVEELIEDIQRKIQEQSLQHAEEIGQLQSTLEMETIERRKQESRSLQSHYASLDASRLGRAFVNSFRSHLRPSADHLLELTRRLLELPLDDQQEKLVETAMESALVLRAGMQDDARLPGEADPTEADKAA